jgi:signal transduction histidine kinase
MSGPVSGTVLNVDDFEPGRYARTRILQKAGFHVLEATAGAEALLVVRDRRPELVLLDINLPDMSGFEVCRTIKSDPKLASTLIVQVSATAISSADWARALETGADAYLSEPVDAPVLIATIRSQMRLARAERALAETNRELMRSNEDLARFAYVASHDLQEPLRTIRSFSQLLSRQYAGRLGADADEYIGFIQESAAHMSDLVRNLLLYSQAGAAPTFASTDLNRVFDRTVVTLRAAIEESGADVTSDPLPSVLADEEQIGRVLLNLVSNAIKYRSERPPSVHVAAVREGDRWIISVADNGVGFPSEYSSSLFEPFSRLDRKKGGTGIGLAIAKRVVESHKGEIWVTSSPGTGSTFFFSLPCGGTAA